MGSASLNSSIINMVKTIVGAGMLALPFAYRAQGIALATTTILISAFTCGLGLLFQVYCAGFVPQGKASFFALSQKTYPSLAVVFDAAIAIKCFGVSVSYLVIVANLLPIIATSFGAGDDSILTERMFWLVISVLVVGPLCFLRSLDSLKYTSIVALCSAAYLVMIVIVHFFLGDTMAERGPISVWEPESASGIISTFPIIVFAFTCAQNTFASLNELRNDTVVRGATLVSSSLGMSTLIYLAVGLSGYLSFGNLVGDNIISMYPKSFASTFGQVAIVVMVIFSYPLQVHPSRASFYNVSTVLLATAKANADGETEPLLASSVPAPAEDEAATPAAVPTTSAAIPDREFRIISILILLIGFCIAASVTSLELVLSFVGSTGATIISFILPGLFGYAFSQADLDNRLVTLSVKQKVVMKYAGLGLFF